MLQVIGGRKDGDYLYVTVQGDTQEEAVSAEARRMAYDARDEFGFSNAGIEATGGTIPVNMLEKDADGAVGKPLSGEELRAMNAEDHRTKIGYRAMFRLRRGL